MIPDDFLQVADVLPEAILLVTREGGILAANSAAAAQLPGGAELQGRPLVDCVADDPESVQRYLRRCARSGSLMLGTLSFEREGAEPVAFRAEGGLLRPADAGREASILLRLRPKSMAGQQFQILGARVAELHREIHARREAEQALLESTTRFEFVLDATGVGRWFAGIPLRELSWDSRTRELFFLPEGTTPTIDQFFERIHPDDEAPTRAVLERAVTDRQPFENDVRTIDPVTGESRWVRSKGMVLCNPQREPMGFEGISFDITSLKEREAELRETDRLKDEFLATLAHELRNPLAPIRTGLEILRMKVDDPAMVEEMRAILERQVDQLIVLVNDLLDVSRLTGGKMQVRLEETDLKAVLRDAVEACRPFIAESGHSLEFHAPEESIVLHGDPVRLTQVFSNLLHNAAKFTPPGGRIRLAARVCTDGVAVTVTDNGRGIPAEELSGIFKMFRQLDGAEGELKAGLGIGLSLVNSLVELHGGRVAVASEGLGKGSEFTVVLPLTTPIPEPGQGLPGDCAERPEPPA